MKKEQRNKKRRSLGFLLWIPIIPVVDYLIMQWAIGIDMQQRPPEGMLGHPAPAFTLVGLALSFLVTCIILVYVLTRLIIFIALKISDRKAEAKKQEMDNQMQNSDEK